MSTNAFPLRHASLHPVRLHVVPSLDERNRLTTAFRCLLAIPHLLLVGGPVALAFIWSSRPNADVRVGWGTGGALGAVAAVCALIAWFAIVFTGTAPDGLARLQRFYLRWRVRATAYMALLRDEYPPFGDDAYPADVELPPPVEPRDRLGVAFLLIAHDLSIVHHASNRIAVMYLGALVEVGDAEAVYSRPCHPYSEALISAIPVPDPQVERNRERVVLEGDPPSPLDPPSGCRYHPRCAYAMDICMTVDPEPTPTADGGTVACHLHTSGPELGGRPLAEFTGRSTVDAVE